MLFVTLFYALLYGYYNTLSDVIINTWGFTNATDRAFEVLKLESHTPALDAIEKGCHICEIQQCDHTVGYGGSPDIYGETTLDALIMEGKLQSTGAVGYIRHYKNAIGIARKVLDYSQHSILVGEGAEKFADMMGMKRSPTLSTDYSKHLYRQWHDRDKCQPNYFKNVHNQSNTCPPYKPMHNNLEKSDTSNKYINLHNHDTISMVSLHYERKEMAAGSSSNGASHKIAGRIGDACIPGSGAYVDQNVGGAGATGDGDILMRFSPASTAVHYMEKGLDPKSACEEAIKPIIYKYPKVKIGLVCLNKEGKYGAAGFGWNFTYSVRTDDMNHSEVFWVTPLSSPKSVKHIISVS